MTQLDKKTLRQQYRTRCRNVAPYVRIQASLQARLHFQNTNWFGTATHFACYLALDYEFDAMPIIQAIWAADKKCYVPVLSGQAKQLQFAAFTRETELMRNRYGILEPVLHHFVELKMLEVVVMPLTAFDRTGHRLGTGGGYYDRTFENAARAQSRFVGLGYAMQQADKLPADFWDVKMDEVVTEEGVVFCR